MEDMQWTGQAKLYVNLESMPLLQSIMVEE